MIKLALGAFAVAAVGGLIAAVRHFREQDIPWGVTILHGLFGAAGLVLLLLPVVNGQAAGLAKIALILFLVAALGGFVLVSFHLRRQRHPSAFIVVHALVAVAAFLLLAYYVLSAA